MLSELIKKYYQNHQDWYFENSANEIGIWVDDYERHPDTGCALANNGYWRNEEEIEEQAQRSFAENFVKVELDYITEEASEEEKNKLEEEIYNIINN